MAAKCGLMPPGFGPVVQLALASLCACVLAFKCRFDKSGRGTVRFLFDSSKNFGGAAWMHVANLLVASLLGKVGSSGADACQWYFIEIMIDTTLGVYVEYKLLEGLLKALRGAGLGRLADLIEEPCIPYEEEQCDVECVASGAANGAIQDPMLRQRRGFRADLSKLLRRLDKGKYFMQLFTWLAVVTGMKFVMVTLMLTQTPQLEAISGYVLNPLRDPNTKLVVVMILTPGVMNALQFWLQDNIFVDIAKGHGEGPAAGTRASAAVADWAAADREISDLNVHIQYEEGQLRSIFESVQKRIRENLSCYMLGSTIQVPLSEFDRVRDHYEQARELWRKKEQIMSDELAELRKFVGGRSRKLQRLS